MESYLYKFVFFFATLLVLYYSFKINNLYFKPISPPKIKNTPWWGYGRPARVAMIARKFEITVKQEILDDLNNRLENSRISKRSFEGSSYGVNYTQLQDLLNFWKTKYNWSDRETFLNKYPQFRVVIQGLNIHFIHVKPEIPINSKDVKVIPLLLIHGWPETVRNFYEIIPYLTTPKLRNNFVFEIIAPSLPGHGFSQPPSKRGFGAAQAAVLLKNLMSSLGHEQFFIQGSSLGSYIATNMAALYPGSVRGLHLNLCFSDSPLSLLKYAIGSLYPSLIIDNEHENIFYPFTNLLARIFRESGDLHLKSTKPDTMGVAFLQSPVGLAAYILDKMGIWDNNSEDISQQEINYISLLDNIMIYWITGTFTTSARLFADTLTTDQYNLHLNRVLIEAPTVCVRFQSDSFYQPDSLLRDKYINLMYSKNFKITQRDAMFKEPEMYSDLIWKTVEIILNKS